MSLSLINYIIVLRNTNLYFRTVIMGQICLAVGMILRQILMGISTSQPYLMKHIKSHFIAKSFEITKNFSL